MCVVVRGQLMGVSSLLLLSRSLESSSSFQLWRQAPLAVKLSC